MKKHGFTQRSLSLACGLTERRIETLIARKGFPDADEALKIAQALHTSVEYLVTGRKPDTGPIIQKLESALDDLKKL
jgi:transcriptional regulator with XRE-family HTH domain